jgi:uncharacterized protein with HEPN domain
MAKRPILRLRHGKVIRHAYDEVDPGILLDISERHLAELERTIDFLLDRHATDGDAS